MATWDADSIDAIVTDPPYGLEFMGARWDHGVPGIPFWSEALRVAKPGAYLLAFGGTRTVHRMTCAIEDAGWEIRDMLVWGYASGFPKSLNLPGGLGTALKPAWEPIVMARKPLRRTVAKNVLEYGTGALNIDGCRIEGAPPEGARGYGHDEEAVTEPQNTPAGRWPANIVLTDPIFDGGWEGVVGGGEVRSGVAVGGLGNAASIYGSSLDKHAADDQGYGDSGTYSRFFQLQEGDGCYLCGRARSADESSLPPSEPDGSVPGPAPIGVSRGTDGDRPPASRPTSGTASPFWPGDDANTPSIPSDRRRATSPARGQASDRARSKGATSPATATTTTTPSRWTCDTCAERVISGSIPPPERLSGHALLPVEEPDYPRFYIVAKAARSDREPVLRGQIEARETLIGAEGHQINPMTGLPVVDIPRENSHPTVKPTELMRHLVRLVTPLDGIVLDCFAGSGSTLLAAEKEGRRWVGIEKEDEYVRIVNARLNGTQRGLGL